MSGFAIGPSFFFIAATTLTMVEEAYKWSRPSLEPSAVRGCFLTMAAHGGVRHMPDIGPHFLVNGPGIAK
jgi:hypothetical protein